MSKYPQIYGLQDPITDEIRYVGKAKNPAERFKKHLKESKSNRRSHYPVYQWINRLSINGLLPNLVVLASSVSDDWKHLEIAMISQLRQEIGKRLLNVANGGDQPSCSDEQRKLNAVKMNATLNTRDDRLKRITYLKQRIAYYINHINDMSPTKAESFLSKLRYAGAKRPDIFGEYRYL